MKYKKIYMDVAQASALLTVCMGLIAIAGWLADLWILHSFRQDYIPMAPSTAALFIILGISLFISTRWSSQHFVTAVSRVLAAVVGIFALLMLIKFFIGADFGIEKIIAGEAGTLRGFPTGRMSPVTASAFLLSGLSQLFLLCIPKAPKSGRYLVVVMAAGVLCIGLAVLTSYFFEAPLLYKGSVIPVALPTAIAFVLLGSGLCASVMPYLSLSIYDTDDLLRTMPVMHGRYLPASVIAIAGALISGTMYAITNKNMSFEAAIVVLFGGLLFTMLLALYLLTTERYSKALRESLTEREKLIAELRQRHIEFSILYHVSSAISREAQLDKLLSDVLNTISELEIFKIDIGGIFVVEGDRMRLAAQLGHSETFIEIHKDLKVGECLCGLVAKTGEVVISQNADKDERHTIRYPEMIQHGHLIVPLKSKDRVEGVLDLYMPVDIKLDEDKVKLMTTIGNQLGIAIERKKNEAEREKLIAELQDALARIKTLKGFVPICSYCKKIRNDKNYWEHLETYITERSEAEFTHSICPDCAAKVKAEIAKMEKDKPKEP